MAFGIEPVEYSGGTPGCQTLNGVKCYDESHLRSL
jgi:hypothetical protein